MTINSKIVFLLIFIIIDCLSVSNAEVITYEFTGVVENSNKPSTFPIGQTISGKYSFESSRPDTFPNDPELGSYNNLLLFTFTSGIYTGLASIATSNNASSIGFSFVNTIRSSDPRAYGVFSPCFTTPDNRCGVTAEGEALASMSLVLENDQNSEIPTDALPRIPPNINNFLVREIGLEFGADGSSSPGVKFLLESLTSDVKPLPPPVDPPKRNQNITPILYLLLTAIE